MNDHRNLHDRATTPAGEFVSHSRIVACADALARGEKVEAAEVTAVEAACRRVLERYSRPKARRAAIRALALIGERERALPLAGKSGDVRRK